MRLNKKQRQERKEMRDDFEMQGGILVFNPEAGYTIAACPAARVEETSLRFVKVVIAQCDFIDDEFKREVGEYIALVRFYAGNTFSIRTHSIDDAILRVETMLDGI